VVAVALEWWRHDGLAVCTGVIAALPGPTPSAIGATLAHAIVLAGLAQLLVTATGFLGLGLHALPIRLHFGVSAEPDGSSRSRFPASSPPASRDKN